MGFGLDLFYNDIYDGKQRTNNRRYNFITSDHFENHLRGGIFWANDLTIDRFTAGIHIGFYPYNPIRVPESYEGYTNDNLTENFPLEICYQVSFFQAPLCDNSGEIAYAEG